VRSRATCAERLGISRKNESFGPDVADEHAQPFDHRLGCRVDAAEGLAVARVDGGYSKVLAGLAKVDALVIDD